MITNELLEILNADKKARERISDADKLSSHMPKKLDEDAVTLECKYKEQSDKIIKESNDNHKKLLDKAHASYKARFDKTEEAITALYEKKKNEWISEIVCSVTKTESS